MFVSGVEDEMTVADTTEQIAFIVTASIEEESATIEDRESPEALALVREVGEKYEKVQSVNQLVCVYRAC